jgi:RNA polymerase sigma-32 factor
VRHMEREEYRVPNHRVLSRDEETALIARYKAGDKKAGDELLSCNQKFVCFNVMRYRRWGVPLDDLHQEGCLGLIRALEKFDPSRGFRFITYAVNWVNAFIRVYLIANHSLVKIGSTPAQRTMFYRLSKIRSELELSGCPEGDVTKEIARLLKVKQSDVEEMEVRMRGTVSLDSPIGEDDGETFLSLQPGPDLLEDFEAADLRRARAIAIERAVKVLNPRELEVIRTAYLQKEPGSRSSLSRIYDCSRTRIGQVEKRALNKLKQRLLELRKHNLVDDSVLESA